MLGRRCVRTSSSVADARPWLQLGIMPDDPDMLQWIQQSLGGPAQPQLVREAGSTIRGLEAQHTVDGSTCLRLQFPPLGACERVAGRAAQDEACGARCWLLVEHASWGPALMAPHAGVADALHAALMQGAGALEQEKAAAADLQEELAFYQARCKKLESKLQELRPESARCACAMACMHALPPRCADACNMRAVVLSATGSFRKRSGDMEKHLSVEAAVPQDSPAGSKKAHITGPIVRDGPGPGGRGRGRRAPVLKPTFGRKLTRT